VTGGELRRRGQAGQHPEHELGGRGGVAVGQAADPGGQARREQASTGSLRHGLVLYGRLADRYEAGFGRERSIELTRPPALWSLRVACVVLPLAAGPAAGEALRAWDDAPRVAAEVLLWAAWGIALLATLAPRPRLLTALRVIAPAMVAVAIACAFSHAVSAGAAVAAIALTVVVAGLSSGHDIAIAAANSAAYGDELRTPLRVPPALFLGLVPAARSVVAAGVVAPVLLLADRDWVWCALATVVGLPLAALAARSLHALSRRWAVLVPAGFVVVDPFTLSDPVLFLRERIVVIAPAPTGPPPPSLRDLRLGAALGSMLVRFTEPAELITAARARRGGETVRVEGIVVAVVRRDAFLAEAAKRRLPVEPGRV